MQRVDDEVLLLYLIFYYLYALATHRPFALSFSLSLSVFLYTAALY